MKKIDKNLLKTIALSNAEKSIDCLIYYNNFIKAKCFLNCQSNVKILCDINLINAFAVRLKCDKIKKLSENDFISYISSNVTVSACVDVSRKILGAKDFVNSNKISIAVIDTGVFPHIDLTLGKNRIIKFVDFVNEKERPYDDNGHGTFVTGIIAGSGLLSNKKYKGFACDCNIVSLKALDEKGEANAIKILEAMQWISNNHEQYNIKIVCMSFGSEPLGYADPIMKGAEALWQKGIVVVSAGGNSGPKQATIKSPGISGKIITVGGFNDNRIDEAFNKNFFEIANFSSCGPALGKFKPDMVAPAVDITSLSNKGDYTILSGTSVSTPMVAGLCATILNIKPNLTPFQVKKLLSASCTPITYNKNKEGNGFPNLTKIIK